MVKLPTTKIVLSNDKKLNGTYPVKIRVTFNRKQKFYPCNVEMTKEEYEQTFFGEKLKRKEKDIKDICTGIEGKALKIIIGLKKFDFEVFESKFYERVSGARMHAAFYRPNDID